MNAAALIIVVTLNPLTAFGAVALCVWAAKAGVLTLRRPAPRRPPKEPTP